jgi:hypothetical protein
MLPWCSCRFGTPSTAKQPDEISALQVGLCDPLIFLVNGLQFSAGSYHCVPLFLECAALQYLEAFRHWRHGRRTAIFWTKQAEVFVILQWIAEWSGEAFNREPANQVLY